MQKPVERFKALFQHKGFQRYAKNTSWLMAEKVLRMVVGLFVGVWVARYLGPEQFGLFSYAQSFVFLFSVVATLGLDGIVVRELVKDQSQRDVLLGTAFILKLFGSVVVFPLLWLGVQFANNDASTNWMIFLIASATVFQSFNVIDFYYQSVVLSKYVAMANTLSLAISSVIKIGLILAEAPLMAFVVMIVFDAVILSLGLLYFYFINNRHKVYQWQFDLNIAKSLLKDSWPLIVSSAMISLYMRIDQVMIKEMLDNNAVGQYAAAVKLSEAWYFLPIVICGSVFPAIASSKKVDERQYYKRLQRLYNLMAFIACIVALIVTFLSGWLIDFLYGEEFKGASEVLLVHVWAGVFVSLGVAAGKWILMENLQVYTNYFLFIGMVFNIVLNLFFIDLYGILGAAIATIFSQAIASYFASFIFVKTRKRFYMLTKSLFAFGVFDLLKMKKLNE